jgi:SAM-dependent methyltransferase
VNTDDVGNFNSIFTVVTTDETRVSSAPQPPGASSPGLAIVTVFEMPSASRIAHSGMPFANPMSEAAVDAAIAALPLPSDPVVLDTGCGDGEILLRTLRAHAPARGVGIDLDADAIAEANERALGLPARFELRDAATVEGWFDAAINVGASHAHGGFPDALMALKALAPVVIYGEGYWQKPPSPAFLDALGGATVDELSDLDGLRAEIRDAGFDIAHESLATEPDWARYEETLAANAEDHGTPDTVAYARRIRHRRALRGGTDTLGFALLVLEA